VELSWQPFILVHDNRTPSYPADSVTATANLSRRTRLRFTSSLRYEQPRTRLKFGERCFAFAGPAAWSSLPSSVIRSRTVYTESFKRHLKTVLFSSVMGLSSSSSSSSSSSLIISCQTQPYTAMKVKYKYNSIGLTVNK